MKPIKALPMNKFRIIVFLLAAFSFSGLATAQETSEPPTNIRTATVKEMQIAGSYVYLLVVEGAEETWLATSPGFIKEINYGDVIEFVGDVEMQDFHSNALDRTFKSLWFVAQIRLKQDDADATENPH